MNHRNRKRSIAGFWDILKKSANRLKRNMPLHLAGATAFFATFSLAPIFVIIIQLLGSIIGEAQIRQKVVQKFAESAPQESVQQLKTIIDGLQQLSGKWYVDVGLILFLLFSSSTLFIIIRTSLYRLWRLKRTREKGVGFGLKKRLFSVALIILAGALIVAGLIGQSMQAFLGDAVAEVSSTAYRYFHSIYKHGISLLVAWVWFTLIFRFLTDARPQWKTVLIGGLFTAVLFSIGKVILQSALSGSNIPSVFGASASLVLLQLFVFYSSLLIYYGAAFTMEWARHYKQPVHLPDYVNYYTIEEKHTKQEIEHDEF